MSAFTALNGGSPKATGSPAEKFIKVCNSDEGNRSQIQASPEIPSVRKDGRSTQTIDRPPFPPGVFAKADAHQKRQRSVSTESASRTAQSPETTPTGSSNRSREMANTKRESSKQFEEEGRDPDVSWLAQHHSRAERNGYDSQQESVASPAEQTTDLSGDALRRASGQQDHSDCTNTSPDAEDRSVAAYGSPYESEQKQDSMLHHDPKKRKRNFSNRTKTGCFTCRRRKKKCDEQKPECNNCMRGGFLCQGYPPQRGAGWPKPDTKALAVPLESKDPSYVPPGAYGMPQHGAHGPQPVKREPLPHYRGQHLRIDPPQGRPLGVVAGDDRPTASTMSTIMSGASATSPENKLSTIPYNPSNVFPTPISANTQAQPFSDRMGKDYQRVPALHDLGRGNEPETPHPGSHLPQINLLHPNQPGSPAAPPPAPPPGPHSQAPSSSVQAAAQLALNHSHTHSLAHSQSQLQSQPHTPSNSQAAHSQSHTQPQPLPPPLPQSQPPSQPPPPSQPQIQAQSQYAQRRTQKEEMLSGRHFYPFDKELCLERERCAAACWRFNNLTSPPTIGVSPDERHRLFLEILQPRDAVRILPSEASIMKNVGRVGRHVAVETPFTCDYGYNIAIGHHVLVGRNCTINDASEVNIGDNCVIGPNVSIFTTSLPIDPKSRQGGQGPQFARAITIEQDCWIAGGAIILPGCTIGKGSTVGAGSVVTRDVPPFTVVSGNPARVMHGVGKEGP